MAAFPPYSTTETVVEYFNIPLGHYFMTANAVEMAAIDAGQAGPGWIRTGYGFTAYPYPLWPGTLCRDYCGEPVHRFRGTPGIGPDSHFFTGSLTESAGLGSGWSREGVAFSIPLPDATGVCRGAYVPVFRLYNNRWMFNDSNHRYVTNPSERSRMKARGWIDEGVAFCAHGAVEVPIKSFAFETALEGNVLPSAECEDEAIRLGSCLAVNNLPVPRKRLFYQDIPSLATGVTGTYGLELYAPPQDPSTFVRFSEVLANVFVQEESSNRRVGIHVDTRDKGPSAYSSVNPLFQFKTTTVPGQGDMRVFPFSGDYESQTQIALKYEVKVRRVTLRGAASHAYGHPTIEFIDMSSGRHLYLTALAYGTVAPAEFIAPDVATGKVIVGTLLRSDSPYLRSMGVGSFFTPSGFVSPDPQGKGGAFEFRVDRSEFQRIIDAARGADSSLSRNPGDYLLDNFHFNNEVVGDGEIGMNIAGFSLELLRR